MSNGEQSHELQSATHCWRRVVAVLPRLLMHVWLQEAHDWLHCGRDHSFLGAGCMPSMCTAIRISRCFCCCMVSLSSLFMSIFGRSSVT